MSAAVTIRRATACEIRAIRHRVLRAGLPPEAAVFEHDDDSTTFHACAVTAAGMIVGSATILLAEYEQRPAWRLRGMAVDPTLHRSGIGRRLLDACDAHARDHGPLQLWCNARTPALSFYQSLGWTRHGVEFEIPTAGPHYRMSKLLQKQ